MNTPLRRLAALCRAALILTMIAGPDVDAAGAKGGKGGGGPKPHAPARPHVSAPRNVRPPHVSPPRNVNPQAVNQARALQLQAARQRRAVQRSFGNQRRGGSYAYRPGARRYRGPSYANRYSSSNRNVRAIVARLRSTHRMLARLDHDYAGHRVRAMHAINTAVRSLSHSSIRNPSGGRGSMGLASNNRQGASRNQPMTQARSDARVRQAAQSLQAVNVQLTNGGTMPTRARALGSVRRAIGELTVALRVR